MHIYDIGPNIVELKCFPLKSRFRSKLINTTYIQLKKWFEGLFSI